MAEGDPPIPGASPVFYLWTLPGLVEVARSCGYALAVHGSMKRDLDLVAIPWTDRAVSAEQLVEALRSQAGGAVPNGPTEKPHGRRAWSILLGGGPYLDVSVMPRVIELPLEDDTLDIPEAWG
jgi:hypothetical protein